MFVVVKKSKTSKRKLVYIVESYRDENQRIRQRIIKKCGELSELEAADPNAMEHIQEEARRMTEQASSKEVDLTINLSLPNYKSPPLVNYGYFFVEALYHTLKIDQFLARRFEDAKHAERIAATLRFFVIREFFYPLTGEKSSHKYLPLFNDDAFMPTPTLQTVAALFPLQADLMKHVYRMANRGHECTDKVASLDITSYIFNSTNEKGSAVRSDESAMSSMILVQMGMLLDRYRNPMACVIFPEGGADGNSLVKELTRLKRAYGLERIVITSDRGFASNSSLAALYRSGNGYVVGRKVKGSSPEMQMQVLDDTGYKWNESGTFKFKSFTAKRMLGGEEVPEKVIAMWTSHNAARMRQRRDKTIVDFLANPQDYEMDVYPQMDRYVQVHDTTETPDERRIDQNFFSFDAESYMRDVALDGYYALATTEMNVPESVIIRRYHDLQKLDTTFGPPDPDVEGVPAELWNHSDVQAYFLISFLAYMLKKKLSDMVGGSYADKELEQALREATCKNIGQDIYDLTVQDEVFHAVAQAFGGASTNRMPRWRCCAGSART